MKRPRYNYDVTSGLSQMTRNLPEQSNTYVAIDEKTESDLFSFVYRFSSYINYYNLSNKREGDWQFFFSNNPHVLLSILNDVNVYSFNFTYDKLSDYIRATNNTNDQVIALENIFVFLYQLILEMHATYERISKISKALSVTNEVDWQEDDIFNLYNQLFIWRNDIQQVEGIAFSTDQWPSLENAANESFIPTNLVFELDDSIQGKIINTLLQLDVFFGDVQAKYIHYLNNGKYIIKKAIQNQDVYYEPHLGVVKSFLQLYAHLQDKINLIPKRHLDFYYQQILGQLPSLQKVDRVHLALTLGSSIAQYLLKKDTIFLAEFPEIENKYLYRTVKDSVLNKANLLFLNNVLISTHKNTEADFESNIVKEKIVYQNSLNVPDFQSKGTKGNIVFPLFGEDPDFSNSSTGNMEFAKFGYLVGSEILYQTTGKRTFTIDIYFGDTSFTTLSNYIKSYSLLIGKHEKVVANELFKAAFNITITTEEGWYELDSYSVKYDFDNLDEKVISYNFQLKEDQPAIVLYNNEIHGGNYPANIPLIYFQLNPNSFHNGYSFLKGLIITRIAFTMKVDQNSQLILSNNLGLISSDNPFTPFGPQPYENAYLDIQNENIFNKFTTNFSLNIAWFNLPTNENGFQEYFKEYGKPVENNSFLVGVSSLDKGKFKPDVEEQQNFELFHSIRKADTVGILSPTTTLNDIDFGKLKFSNDMSLEKDSEDILLNTQKGVVRIQLLSPSDPFGHKRFNQLFSDTSIHNSKKFTKKRELPKEPYTPYIKSIHVNFTLFSSDILNRGFIDDNFETDIKFIHVHPFGHDLIYPNSKQPSFKLIPDYPSDRQFYIGVNNVSPSDELTIYFELKDLKPTHSVINKPVISWSYLQENTWKTLTSNYILSDSTDGFIRSGLVTLLLPTDINSDNTVLPPDIYWISAQLHGSADYSMQLICLYANALEVERIDNGDNFHLAALPAATITQSQLPLPEVDTILQPFASFGSVFAETYDQFNTRISELLRSKNRFITTRDLTQQILNHFPSLAYVHCMANGRQTDLLLENMDILIMVVPVIQSFNKYNENSLPNVDFSELSIINSFIKSILPPSIKFVVTNPIYEFVKVKCSVQFESTRINLKVNANISRLNDDIINFISPWLSIAETEFKELKVLYVNDIINFIQKRNYIHYVTSVSLLHFYQYKNPKTSQLLNVVIDTAQHSKESVTASLPGALLVPMAEHNIEIVTNDSFIPASVSGINNYILGKELILNEALTSEIQNRLETNQIKKPTFTLTLKL